MGLSLGIPAYLVVAYALGWIATELRGTKLSWPFALLIYCGAAYAIGCSIEIFLLQVTNVIPGGQRWPVVAVLGVTGFVIAALAKPSGLLAAIPCGVAAALIILLTLLGNNGGSEQVPASTQPPSHPAQVSIKAADWNFRHSGNVDTRLSPTLGGVFHFDFRFPESVYYLVTTASPVLTQGWYVKMSGAIHASHDAEDYWNSPPGPPARCWMYFQEIGDDFSGQGRYAYFRWWSTKALILHAASFVQFVGLEPEFWSTVMGERGDASAAATAGFQQALANPQSIGIMCAGAYIRFFDDDGDNLSSSYHDAATFIMGSFAVCDPFHRPMDQACAPPGRRVGVDYKVPGSRLSPFSEAYTNSRRD